MAEVTEVAAGAPAREPMQALWIGESLGVLQRLSIASFLAQGHPYRLYTYERVSGVPDGVELRDAREIHPESAIFRYVAGPGAGSPAVFANLFRYTLLARHGGWWVDADVLCVRPFVGSPARLVCSEPTQAGHLKINNAVMRFDAGDELMRVCEIEAATDPMRALIWGTTGPDLVSRLWHERPELRPAVASPRVFSPIPWWDVGVMIEPDPARCHAMITPDTIGLHLYNEAWRRRGGVPTDAVPESSYLGGLLRQFG